MENEKNRLHDLIYQKMKNLGEISPDTFRQTALEDPQLIVSYLKSMNLDAEAVEIAEIGQDNVRLSIRLRDSAEPKYARVFFTGAKN